MENIEIYLVTEHGLIANWWTAVVQDLRKVLKYSFREESEGSILSKITSNDLYLWLVFKDKEYIGFFTTQRVTNFHEKDPVSTLYIRHTYNRIKNSWTINKKVNAFIENHAKMNDCKYITCFTTRTNDRYWGRLGFKPRYTEYTKEVQ